jgi:hypothetical protein
MTVTSAMAIWARLLLLSIAGDAGATAHLKIAADRIDLEYFAAIPHQERDEGHTRLCRCGPHVINLPW